MGKGKTAEKQKIILLSQGILIFEISNGIYRDHGTVDKWDFGNISNFRTRSKGKKIKKLVPR